MAFAALGNDGLLLKPRLIRRIYAPDGQVVLDNSTPQPVRQVIAPDLCRQFVREVLARVPTREGTGRRAQLDGWSSFGKTGTAQISPYGSGKYTASYIAAAPVEASRLVCLISVRKPDRAVGYYGGTVAAPAVKEVLEKSLAYLNVPKDAG
jgi:cell division protein FtsI/penicillin-binding protein 2